MQVTTLVTLPEDIYKFYRNYALRLEGCTMEQLMAEVLADFAKRMTVPTTEESN